MKLPHLLAILTATAVVANAEVNPIRLTIDPASKTASKPGAKGQPSQDHTQTRSLKIQLDNLSTQAFDGLVVKYWFVGHSMTDHGMKVLVEGERKATLAPRGKDNVETEVVTKSYVEAHNSTTAGGKGGKAGKTTKVAASGEKIMGYGVRVIKDGKVLGEYFSDSAYKPIIDKAPAATAAAPGAKPAKK